MLYDLSEIRKIQIGNTKCILRFLSEGILQIQAYGVSQENGDCNFRRVVRQVAELVVDFVSREHYSK